MAVATGLGAAGSEADEAARRAWEDEQARNDVRAMLENMKAAQEAKQRRANQLPYPDPVTDGVTMPVSAWIEADRARHRVLLQEFRADVLIVPVQVQASGVSRSSRALMTESLAMALAPGARVAPPRLVAGALGDGQRQVDRREVIDLANALRVRRIIWAWAGHRDDQRLHLYFEVQDLDKRMAFAADDARRPVTLEPLSFTNERLPLQVFREELPRVAQALGYTPSRPAQLPATALPSRFPPTLGDIAREKLPVVERALYLQLLASLIPEDADRARERLYERSLAIAWQLPPEHAATRLLLARAYHGLQMRQAALAVLAKPKDDAERALLAALNGNLDELDQARSRLPQSPLRLMADIDATEIRFAYESETATSAAEREAVLGALPKPWAQLAARRFIDADPMQLNRIDPLPALELLGQAFPGAGPAASARLRGGMVAGQSDAADVELALAPYLRTDVVKLDPHVCCTGGDAADARSTQLDVLDFLVESMTANVLYKAHRLIESQGLHREGLRYLDDVSAVFDGHPGLTALRAYAEQRLAEAADPAVQQALAQRAAATMDKSQAWGARGGRHASDLPMLFALSPSQWSGDRSRLAQIWGPAARAALANSSHRTDVLRASFDLFESIAEREALLKSVAGRFQGSAMPVILRAELEGQKGKPEAARAVLNEAARKGLPGWDLYQRLGYGLVDEGRYDEASAAFNAYPGFQRGSRVHPVMRDNNAYAAGSLLFWRDRTDLALPLYKIAAESQTGSHSGFISAARIGLLAGDYATAARYHHESMRRYDFDWSHRDFYALMHMLGEGKTAWDGLRVTIPRLRVPQLWHAALVGHRREGLGEAQYGKWLRDNGFVRPQQLERWATQYLAMAAIVDRVPGQASLDEIGRVEAIRKESELLQPFVRAYRAIRQRDFAGAEQTLAAAMDQGGLRAISRNTYVLPYYALAAVRAGKTAAAESRLAALPPDWSDHMDLLLARAVLDGATGKAGASGGFDKAFARRVFAENRPLLIEYQFADLAMSLHDLTGVAAYRDFALRMARFNQRVQPWEAWSWALAANLLEAGDERRSALQRAVYLDPQSVWVSRLPAKEVEAARTAVRANPPFTVPASRGRIDRGA